MIEPAARRSKARVGRLAIWFAVLTALLIWGALQPPTRLEPVPWTGTLDI